MDTQAFLKSYYKLQIRRCAATHNWIPERCPSTCSARNGHTRAREGVLVKLSNTQPTQTLLTPVRSSSCCLGLLSLVGLVWMHQCICLCNFVCYIPCILCVLHTMHQCICLCNFVCYIPCISRSVIWFGCIPPQDKAERITACVDTIQYRL